MQEMKNKNREFDKNKKKKNKKNKVGGSSITLYELHDNVNRMYSNNELMWV